MRPALFGSQGGQKDLLVFMAGHKGDKRNFFKGTNGSFRFHQRAGGGIEHAVSKSMLRANRCADATIRNIDEFV